MDILSGSFPGEIYVFYRKSNGTYAAADKLKTKDGRLINVGRASTVAAADWDGDGKVDLVIGNIDGGVFLSTNEGTAQSPAFRNATRLFGKANSSNATGKPVTAEGGDAGPCLADWDGDGKLDLLLGSGSGKVYWYRNVGSGGKPELDEPRPLVTEASGEFKNASGFDSPKTCGMRSKPAVADWNGDGKPDLLVGDFSFLTAGGRQPARHGWVWVYLRNGDGKLAVK